MLKLETNLADPIQIALYYPPPPSHTDPHVGTRHHRADAKEITDETPACQRTASGNLLKDVDPG